jgi:hypothetical protein
MTSDYYAVGEYYYQARYIKLNVISILNYYIVIDGRYLERISKHGLDFLITWRAPFLREKGIEEIYKTVISCNDWNLGHENSNDMMKVTGNIENFERDMLALKMIRSN